MIVITTMSSVYSVPIIPQNLRRDETIVQIADALGYLSKVATDLLGRVNSRVEANKNQLSSLSHRIDAARLKVSKLTGAKKATQVFSSSKYPAADAHRPYTSIFEDDKKLVFYRSKVKYKDVQVKDESIETLQFYHVKVCEAGDLQNTNGLGDVPKDIKSLNDLLLYNTGKNPYKNYVMSDPLQTSLRMKKDDTVDVSDIGAAPHSISERTTLTRSATESYFYSPDLGDVPSIDVPLDLPDLPGIANDLRYVDELGPGIAPSVTTTPNLTDLPLLEEPVLLTTKNDTALESLLLPPPPPTIEETPVPTRIEEKPSEPLSQHKVDKIVNVIPVLETVADQTENVVTVIADNAHASLMEAIRKAGGSKNAKLKTAEPKKTAASGGDLMADLHAKLSLRRKGISGAKQSDGIGFDAGSTLNKVSAMIPPPPPTKIEASTTEDEDWE